VYQPRQGRKKTAIGPSYAPSGAHEEKEEKARIARSLPAKLGPSEALVQSSYDAYKSAYEVAKANVAVGEATIV
jgi:hypothetical protein